MNDESAAAFANFGLALLVVHTPDMERSARFFQAIGLRMVRHAHPPCGEHYATVEGPCLFEIYQRPAATAPLTFGFQVSALERVIEAAEVHGGRLKRAPQRGEWGRSATIIDPDGNVVLLMERGPNSPAG